MKKIRAFFQALGRRWLYKLVVGLCVGVVYSMFAYQSSRNAAVAYVSLNYPEALSGQYLNGTRLNMYDILSEETLEGAIEKAGLQGWMSAAELGDMLNVAPRRSSAPEKKYIATEFEISLNMKEPLGGVQADGLLQMVCMAFVENFYGAHFYNQTVLSFSLDQLEDREYDEIGTMLQTKADLMADYVDFRYRSQPDFLSTETGESFSSLRKRIQDFTDIVLESYNAYLLENGLTRDRSALQSAFDYEQAILENRYAAYMAQYDVRIAAIERYDAIQSAVVMIPTLDAAGEFYMSKTKIGVDYLSEEANRYMGLAKDVKKKLERNQVRMARVLAANGNTVALAETRIQAMLESILRTVGELEELVIETDDEYIRSQMSKSVLYRIRNASDTERYQLRNTLLVVLGSFLCLTALDWSLAQRLPRKPFRKRKGGQPDA